LSGRLRSIRDALRPVFVRTKLCGVGVAPGVTPGRCDKGRGCHKATVTNPVVTLARRDYAALKAKPTWQQEGERAPPVVS